MAILTLPGLIDPHVHLRDPGQIQKEDFATGTAAAIAGGFTTVLDMPNNVRLIDSEELLDEKIEIAKTKIYCDIGFYFGSLGNNIDEFEKIYSKVKGLKLFLSSTTGGYIIDRDRVETVFNAWSKDRMILLHADNDSLDFALDLAAKTGNAVHICHVATRNDLEKVIKAKKQGLNVTCGVTPHHLFLTYNDLEKLGTFAKVKPPLATENDQKFLWENLKSIDMIESDHAPHTLEEKKSENSPYGVPNLETTLPLLLTAIANSKITIDEVIRLCHTGPAKRFSINLDTDTNVEIDTDEEYVIKNKNLKTKCGWSPFEGRKVKGKIKKVFLRGTKVFEDDTILVEKGFGHVL
ncbi:MAG TPA: amidohydrolase family protein [Candidatus Saccharimonadales bacterium]|nr:amidohydrolase family protein [Candidatus Saccharimonadales bacterium]